MPSADTTPSPGNSPAAADAIDPTVTAALIQAGHDPATIDWPEVTRAEHVDTFDPREVFTDITPRGCVVVHGRLAGRFHWFCLNCKAHDVARNAPGYDTAWYWHERERGR